MSLRLYNGNSPIGSLKFDASSEKFGASQHWVSEAILYFNPYKLNFNTIGYRKDLHMFNSYHLTKQSKKLGAAVCVFLWFMRRGFNWNYSSFPIWTFVIKRQTKDEMSVSLFESVNSAIIL